MDQQQQQQPRHPPKLSLYFTPPHCFTKPFSLPLLVSFHVALIDIDFRSAHLRKSFFFLFSYSSHPLTHSFTPCFISTTPAGHAFQPHQPLHFLSTHDISIHPPLTLHFVSTLTHSLAHFTLRSICFLLPLPLPATLRCRPTYGMNQRGAVTKSTQLKTREEDHATLCDPLAVAAGDAVCASLAFSITAPPPHTTHKTHSALQLNGARPPEPKRNCLIQYHM